MSREIWAIVGVFVAIIGGFIALAGLMLTGHSNIRSDMNAAHEAIRSDMSAAHEGIRSDMNAAHEGIQNALRQIRDQLGSVDRRTARIEGHLFGIEIAEEP